LRALVAALILPLAALGMAGPGASASDLESIRERAQTLGDQVSELEHRLDNLHTHQAQLEAEVSKVSSEIGVIELSLHDAEQAYEIARARYVERAVEIYKAGSSSKLALLLSAQTLDQMFTLADAQIESSAEDTRALDELLLARTEAEAAQGVVDARKQKLLVAKARIDALTNEIESTVSSRRHILRQLTSQISAIEAQAREAASLAAHPTKAFLELLQPSGPTPGIPKGFVGTGVTFEGIASWYGPGFEGNHTASGDVFDPSLFTAASKELPLGTWLFVAHGGRGVVVLVNDRGPYVDDRVIDLSQAAAEAIGITGLGWIEAEILLKA
jgi:rare lipoprotein A